MILLEQDVNVIDNVLQFVERETGVKPEVVKSRSRKAELCSIRAAITYALHNNGWVHEKISRSIGRSHHTNSMNSLKDYHRMVEYPYNYVEEDCVRLGKKLRQYVEANLIFGYVTKLDRVNAAKNMTKAGSGLSAIIGIVADKNCSLVVKNNGGALLSVGVFENEK